MDDFEQQLKAALARQDPSPFFEAKVLNAAKRQTRERRTTMRLRWVSAIAAGVLAISGVVWQHERAVQERAAGEAAKARLELALKITSVKLQKIQQRVSHE